MLHKHRESPIPLLPVLLALVATVTGCVTSTQPTATSIEDYIPLARSQQAPPNQESTSGALDRNPTPEDDDSSEALTLAACVQIALDRNPASSAVRQGVVIAEETVGIAVAPFCPEFGLTTSWNRSQRSSSLPGGPTQPMPLSAESSTDDWLAGFTARYTILDGGRRAAEHRRAIAHKGAAAAEARRVREDIVYEVQSSFYRLAAATQVHGVTEENLSRAKAHLQLAQHLKKAGAVPRADVLRAEVEAAEAELALTRATSLTRVTRGQLSIAMGLPAASSFEIDPEFRDLAAPILSEPETLIEDALHCRPEIAAALQQISADEAGVAVAKSAYRPRIYAEAGWDYRDSDFPPENEEWSVGLTLNWTVFSGFSRKHEVNRARAQLSRQEAEIQQLILQVQQEVWSARSQVIETWERILTTEMQVDSALESMRAARRRYEVGAATINDLLDAQTALARTETNRTEAIWDHLIAEAWLDRVRGQASGAGPEDGY